MRRLVAGALAVVALSTGCGAEDGGPAPAGGPAVLATTTILGDVAGRVVGDEGVVQTLLPIGADPHDFAASSRMAARIVSADLVVANGLGLEGGLAGVLDAAADDGARVLEVGPLLDPLIGPGGQPDPHVWMDPLRMGRAALLIADHLTDSHPGGAWRARAEAYASDLATTDATIRELLQGVRPQDRLLVTNHDSLGYFADRYGFRIVGVIIPGGSTIAEPSAARLSALVDAMNGGGVRAIFAESIDSTALAEAVAAEMGGRVAVVELLTGSLGPVGSEFDTLIGMLTTDAGLIATALAP